MIFTFLADVLNLISCWATGQYRCFLTLHLIDCRCSCTNRFTGPVWSDIHQMMLHHSVKGKNCSTSSAYTVRHQSHAEVQQFQLWNSHFKNIFNKYQVISGSSTTEVWLDWKLRWHATALETHRMFWQPASCLVPAWPRLSNIHEVLLKVLHCCFTNVIQQLLDVQLGIQEYLQFNSVFNKIWIKEPLLGLTTIVNQARGSCYDKAWKLPGLVILLIIKYSLGNTAEASPGYHWACLREQNHPLLD